MRTLYQTSTREVRALNRGIGAVQVVFSSEFFGGCGFLSPEDTPKKSMVDFRINSCSDKSKLF